MKNNTKKYKVLNLFAGAGGFSYGFSLVNDGGKKPFEIVKAVEIDPYACKTLRGHLEIENYNKGKIVYEGDLTKDQIKNKIIKDCRGKVDIIIGGPPCQTFSLAGPSRSGSRKMREALKEDKRNILFKHYLELVEKINPKFVVFENVKGITSKDSNDISGIDSKNQKVIELICGELKKIGYELRNNKFPDHEYMVLNAADYGVPQERKRVFIIANRIDKESVLNPYPEPKYGNNCLRPYITVSSAIGDLPSLLPVFTVRSFKNLKKIDFVIKNYIDYLLKLREEVSKLRNNFLHDEYMAEFERLISMEVNKYKNYNVTYEDVLDFIKKANKFLKKIRQTEEYNNSSINEYYLDNEIKAFRTYIKGDAKKLTLHNARTHNFRDIIIFTLMKAGTTSAHFFTENSNFYLDKKLKKQLQKLYPYDSSKHVDTYVKHSPDKPSKTILAHLAKDGLRFIHPEQPRTFTPREVARLQSFPDDFYFYGPMISQYKQIGNAVPPLLAKAIGEAIYNKLKNSKKEDRKEVVPVYG